MQATNGAALASHTSELHGTAIGNFFDSLYDFWRVKLLKVSIWQLEHHVPAHLQRPVPALNNHAHVYSQLSAVWLFGWLFGISLAYVVCTLKRNTKLFSRGRRSVRRVHELQSWGSHTKMDTFEESVSTGPQRGLLLWPPHRTDEIKKTRKKLAQMIPINKSHYTRRISFSR